MEEGGGRNEDDDDDFDGEVEGVEEDEALENSARNVNASSNSWGMLWVLLMTAATLVGRRALRGGFRMSLTDFSFLFHIWVGFGVEVVRF